MSFRIIDIDKWQEIFGTIWRNKLRTVLTALGVFWGIAMLVILLGSGNGLENGVKSMFGGFAINSMYVWPQKTTMPYQGLQPGRFYSFRNADVSAVKQLNELDVVSPRMQLGGFQNGNNISRKNKSGNYQVMGDYPDFLKIQALNITNGRFLNPLDIKDSRKVCVIGQQVYKELFEPGEDPVGDYIKIQGVYFGIVGMFTSMKKGDEADRDGQTIFIPFTTFQQAFNRGDRFDWFAITTADGVDAEMAEKKVKTVLASQHKINPEDTRAIGAFNAQKETDKFNGLFAGIGAFIWIVGLGTLIAGAVGVSNIMLIVVSERTKEIGLRKALGAKPIAIISMIVQESVLLTTLAGYFGLVFGVGILEGVNYLMVEYDMESAFFSNPEVDFSVAVWATVVLIVAGAFAGFMPAVRAASINPIEALRTE